MKKVAILGSTGSIGTQTLEIIRDNEDLQAVALAAGQNVDLMENQIREFHPQIAGTAGRSVMLDRFCAYLAENREVWCSTCLDIAQHFLAAQEVTAC